MFFYHFYLLCSRLKRSRSFYWLVRLICLFPFLISAASKTSGKLSQVYFSTATYKWLSLLFPCKKNTKIGIELKITGEKLSC